MDEFTEMLGPCLAKVLPDFTTLNVAVSGSGITPAARSSHASDWSHKTSSRSASIVMTTGGNDLIHNYGRSAPKEGAMYGASCPSKRNRGSG